MSVSHVSFHMERYPSENDLPIWYGTIKQASITVLPSPSSLKSAYLQSTGFCFLSALPLYKRLAVFSGCW